MKKIGIASGLVTLFAVAAIGVVIADSAGHFNTQKFDLTVAQKYAADPHGTGEPLTVEDINGKVFVLRGGLRNSSSALFERLEEGQTYCAVRGEPVIMRKPPQPILIGIHANGPCPKS